MVIRLIFLLHLFILLFIAGCFGGGSGNNNKAPVAVAGDDQLVSRSTQVTLDGSHSSDADGDSLSFSWVQIAGPDVTGGSGRLTGASPAFTAPADVDTIVFRLVVNDGRANSAARTVAIIVVEDADVAFFVNAGNGSDDSGDGSLQAPFASVAKALCEVTHLQQDIYVMAQENNVAYDETTDPCQGQPARTGDQILAVPTGTSLYGGYDANWHRDRVNNRTRLTTLHHGVVFSSVDVDTWFSGFDVQSNNSPSAGDSTYALSALAGDAHIYIQDNQLIAGDVGAGLANNPGSSYGLRVALIEAANIERNIIRAGSAGHAEDVVSVFTSAAQNGVRGSDAAGIVGGQGGQGGISAGGEINAGGDGGNARGERTCHLCAGFDGGYGALAGTIGGSKGSGGNNTSSTRDGEDGSNGSPHSPGLSGDAGATGYAGSGAGRMLAESANGFKVAFVPGNGEQGRTGQAGVGGGGGGGGQASVNSLILESAKGGGGGGGGGGGAGGIGGAGGPGGGASIGLFVAAVKNALVNDNTIVSQAGGNGAAGGMGQNGGIGGAPGSGANGSTIFAVGYGGDGGNGGYGGNGGSGGRGGAGGGGPSYGIALGVNTSPAITNNVITTGNGGQGGTGSGGNGEGGYTYGIYYDGVRDVAVPLVSNRYYIDGIPGTDGKAGEVVEAGHLIQPVERVAEVTFPVRLPCKIHTETDDADCVPETIRIPDGRPVYALLVSGFHQNRNFELLHFYNFARCLQKKGAYVHYAWWNNLLDPYMKRPLHNRASVPSQGGGFPEFELENLTGKPVAPANRKAIPGDDYQFQADAKALLEAIHVQEPGAKIILVGHSFGGAAVARLAQNGTINNVNIALLAPIDPVGNRHCLPWEPGDIKNNCHGYSNFKRVYAVGQDYYYFPRAKDFAVNVERLYYRWQEEGPPPNDWGLEMYYTYANDPSTNHQSKFNGNANSHLEAEDPNFRNYGAFDGHGEIAGFRGSLVGFDWTEFHVTADADPVGVKAKGNWPALVRDDFDNITEINSEQRVEAMKQWDRQWDYLDIMGYSPSVPSGDAEKCPNIADDNHGNDDACTYCGVSADLCQILNDYIVTP